MEYVGGGSVLDLMGHVSLTEAHIQTIMHEMLMGLQYLHSQRSEEHTSELQSPVPISYAVFCLKKKKSNNTTY